MLDLIRNLRVPDLKSFMNNFTVRGPGVAYDDDFDDDDFDGDDDFDDDDDDDDWEADEGDWNGDWDGDWVAVTSR